MKENGVSQGGKIRVLYRCRFYKGLDFRELSCTLLPLMGRLAKETIKGVKWGLIQRMTMQPVYFLFGVILARLITPEEFGILGLTSIFFAIATRLQDCGFGSALIRKQDRTEEDCSTMFWYNVGASFVLSSCLFLAAPWFADFFHQPALVDLTRVSAVMMFLGSTASVHRTLFSARRDFKTPAIIGIVATLAGMPICIYLAYNGWSYWSMVIQGVVTNLLGLIMVWVSSPWKPRLLWSNKSFKEFFGFGSKLVLSGLADTAYAHSRQFVIGKFYTPASLGNFNKGHHLAAMPSTLLNSVVHSVIYPVLATIQNDEERLVSAYRKYIRLNNIVNQIVLWTMVCNAQALILFLYGDSWEEAYIYAQLVCFGTALNALSGVSSNIFMVKGRTDIVLKITVCVKVMSILAMLGCAWISIVAICYAAIFSGFLWLVLVLYYTTKVTSLDYKKQLADYVPYVLFSIAANIPSLCVAETDWGCFLKLLVGGSCALFIYSVLLYLRKDEMAAELLRIGLNSKICVRIRSLFRKAA